MVEPLHPNHPLIQRLRCKRHGGPGSAAIRPVLLLTSGGMRGIYGAGTVLALQALDLIDAFDAVVGISAGAAIAAYLLGGHEQARIGVRVYLEDCTSPRFFSFRRPTRIVDTRYIAALMRTGPKRLDLDAIRAARSAFWVGFTNARTGRTELVDAKTARPDMVAAIQASMSIVGVTPGTTAVNGIPGLDGWIDPLPLQRITRQLRATDILVVPNCTPSELQARSHPRLTELLLALLSLRYGHLTIPRQVLRQPRRIQAAWRWAHQTRSVNVGFVWAPDRRVNQLCRNPRVLSEAMQAAYHDTMRTFSNKDQ